MAAQKHHYIPKFYLRQWTGADGQLVEFCRRHFGRVYPRLTHPGGTGYVHGLYSIKDVAPYAKDAFEDKFMSVADGIAAESLHVMITQHVVPTGTQKLGWTRFMMSLLYRTPEGVERSMAMIRRYYEEEHLDELREVYLDLKRPEDPGTPEEYVRMHSARMTSYTTFQHLMDIIESKRVQEKIMNMQWHLGRMENLRYPLLTGDRPIVMTNGIIYPDSHIVMPLSPKHIFVATNTDEVAEKIKSTRDLGSHLNDRIARQARKFVYSNDKSQLQFIENRLGEKATCSPFE